MDAISLYSFSTLAWLSAQAAPLIIWPMFVSQLLTPNYSPANDVETYFARSLGFSLLAIGLLTVVLSGAVPLTTSIDVSANTPSPYANAVILISTLYHGTAAFYSYAKFSSPQPEAGYIFGAIGSSLLAAFGLWCLMFGGGSHISKRTGADKRTSGFPFSNAEASKRKPKGL